MPDDTGEFMLGDVYVTVVLMESSTQTGPVNNNSETWLPHQIARVKQNIQEGLRWWEDTLATRTDRHHLNFEIDFTYADNPVITNYEPITQVSSDFQFWIYDFLNVVGYNTGGNFHTDIRAFNHAQRTAHNTDWAFTIFIVNDENDSDRQFKSGGFSRAFAFAGGEFIVSLANRPASTISHEVGHQFWGLDEYAPVGNYHSFRGYYNTQNVNAANNPTPGFVQANSIMSNNQSLDFAYAGNTSPASTLEMIGWRDSDGDGVFDVLDVPFTLTGSGSYDPLARVYRFAGNSSVQTLPNRNTSGLKNDITINVISRAEYRFDGGNWQTAEVYGTPRAELDLEIPVPAGAKAIEIRTLDDITEVSSPVFRGLLDRPAGVLRPGLNGVVWRDNDSDGQLDFNEAGLSGVHVRLVNQAGQPLQLKQTIEPDQHASGTRMNNLAAGVTLSAFGSGVTNDTVAAVSATNASTGGNIFANVGTGCGSFCTDWTPETRQLKIDFTSPVSTLSLDAIGTSVPGYARLEVYGVNNELLARYTTQRLAPAAVETMTVSRDRPDIKYAIARGHMNSAVRLDHLRVGPETSTFTDVHGAFSLPYLAAGTYHVEVVPNARQTATNPASAVQTVVLAEGEFQDGVDFGLSVAGSRWQNANNRFDVNGDGFVAPLDALGVINDLNRFGPRQLTAADPSPPYVDVDGDFQATPLDALQIINRLNGTGSSQGSGASAAGAAGGSLASGGEGEAEGESVAASGRVSATVGPLVLASFVSDIPDDEDDAEPKSTDSAVDHAPLPAHVFVFGVPSEREANASRRQPLLAAHADAVQIELECVLDDLAEDPFRV